MARTPPVQKGLPISILTELEAKYLLLKEEEDLYIQKLPSEEAIRIAILPQSDT